MWTDQQPTIWSLSRENTKLRAELAAANEACSGYAAAIEVQGRLLAAANERAERAEGIATEIAIERGELKLQRDTAQAGWKEAVEGLRLCSYDERLQCSGQDDYLLVKIRAIITRFDARAK